MSILVNIDCRRSGRSGLSSIFKRTRKIQRTKRGDNFLRSKYKYGQIKGRNFTVGIGLIESFVRSTFKFKISTTDTFLDLLKKHKSCGKLD